MNRAIFFALPLIAVLLIRCDDREIKPKTPVMTIEVDDRAFATNQIKWIYITDPAGNLLDKKRLKVGTLTLGAEVVPEYVDVTLYTLTLQDDTRSHNVVTVLHVPVNKTLHFTRAPLLVRPSIGSFNFEINYWPYYDYSMGTPFFVSPIIFNGFPISPNTNFLDGKLTGVNPLFSSKSDVLFVAYRNYERVYHWVPGVSPNDLVQLDMADFTPFEHTLDLPNESAVGSVVAHKNGLQYFLGHQYMNLSTGKFSLGYVDGFDYYTTQASLFSVLNPIMYLKAGSPAESIDLTEDDGVLYNRTLGNFQYAGAPATQYAVTFTVQGKAINWEVISGESSFEIRFVPAELKESFPGIGIGDFRFLFMDMKRCMDGRTYDQLVDEYFHVTQPSQFFEYYQVRKNY